MHVVSIRSSNNFVRCFTTESTEQESVFQNEIIKLMNLLVYLDGGHKRPFLMLQKRKYTSR